MPASFGDSGISRLRGNGLSSARSVFLLEPITQSGSSTLNRCMSVSFNWIYVFEVYQMKHIGKKNVRCQKTEAGVGLVEGSPLQGALIAIAIGV